MATPPVDKMENLLGMAAAGYGGAIVPEMVVRQTVPACSLRASRPPAPTFHLKLLWRREAPSPRLLNFLPVAKRWTKHSDEKS